MTTFDEQLENLRTKINQEARDERKRSECSVFDAYKFAKQDVLSREIYSLTYEPLPEQVDLLKVILIVILTDKGPRG